MESIKQFTEKYDPVSLAALHAKAELAVSTLRNALLGIALGRVFSKQRNDLDETIAQAVDSVFDYEERLSEIKICLLSMEFATSKASQTDTSSQETREILTQVSNIQMTCTMEVKDILGSIKKFAALIYLKGIH